MQLFFPQVANTRSNPPSPTKINNPMWDIHEASHQQPSTSATNYQMGQQRFPAQAKNYQMGQQRFPAQATNYQIGQQPSTPATNYQIGQQQPPTQATNYQIGQQQPPTQATNYQMGQQRFPAQAKNNQMGQQQPSTSATNYQIGQQQPPTQATNYQMGQQRFPAQAKNNQMGQQQPSTSATNYQIGQQQPPTQATNYQMGQQRFPAQAKNNQMGQQQPSTSATNYQMGQQQPPTQATNYQIGQQQPSTSAKNYQMGQQQPLTQATNYQIGQQQPSTQATNYQMGQQRFPAPATNYQIGQQQPPTQATNYQMGQQRFPAQAKNNQMGQQQPPTQATNYQIGQQQPSTSAKNYQMGQQQPLTQATNYQIGQQQPSTQATNYQMGQQQPLAPATNFYRENSSKYKPLKDTADLKNDAEWDILINKEDSKDAFEDNFNPFKEKKQTNSELSKNSWESFENEVFSQSKKDKIEELDFGGDKGRCVLEILIPMCDSKSDLLKKIRSKDLILQDQIGCGLRERDTASYEKVKSYLSTFKESRHFLEFRTELKVDEMEKIRRLNLEDIPNISNELNIVQSVIKKCMLQFELSVQEDKHYSKIQFDSLLKLATSSKSLNVITIKEYKKINTYSHRTYMETLENESEKLTIDKLYPSITLIVFYCIKCRLPLDDITRILSEIYDPGAPEINYELFQVIFQHSDPIVKALCIDDYSYSSPVPFYYPLLSPLNHKAPYFKVCQELWFTFPTCLAVTSVGIGGANCRKIGKSFLLDTIFETDFTETNKNLNPFHFRSIDVQITKNIHIECSNPSEENKIAYFDCHGGVSSKVALTLCKYSNIIIVQVLKRDMEHNKIYITNELVNISSLEKLTIVFIRDCEEKDIECKAKESIYYISIPKVELITPKGLKKLKLFFRKIFNPKSKTIHKVDQCLIEYVLRDLDDDGVKAILNSKSKIDKVIHLIEKFRVRKHGIGLKNNDFLSFYPIFVKYMDSYHRIIRETDQDVVDQLNIESFSLVEILKKINVSPIISAFLEIFECNYSGLLLWRLSKYLAKVNENNPTDQKYQYSIDILWRESLLCFKFNQDIDKNTLTFKLNSCFNKQIQEGEPFELIDGDNLVFYSKDIDTLLNHYYGIQRAFNDRFDKGKKMSLSSAPNVISIFGPQSSGKSTLLNYCFGCRFVTSAGRCTKGVYGSLFQMKEILNNSRTLLILDTEGLDAIERGESERDTMFNFDRTMALFCLSVSQVVIINIKGDIGAEIKNLLQVCAYSLNRLKVNKVSLPKIFLVLNQQANINVNYHEASLNLLLKSLDSIYYTAEFECIKISDLIKVSKHDLFVLPSAFNTTYLEDSPLCSDDDSQVLKLQSTKQFANKCSDLRTAIFNAIQDRDYHEKPPYNSVSEWIQMAGLIWETCVKYQDIVRFRDMEEMVFSEKIREIGDKLIDEEIYQKAPIFQSRLEKILKEIDTDEISSNVTDFLTKYMEKFDETFSSCRNACKLKYDSQVRSHPMNKQFDLVCKQAESNLDRLIFVFRKNYEDKIKFRIHYIMLEVKMRESMKRFQDKIEFEIDHYINYSLEQQVGEFEKLWKECYEAEYEDDSKIRKEFFEILYTNFKIECNFIQKRQSIYQLFREYDFNMHTVISETEKMVLAGLLNSDTTDPEECFFCVKSQSYGDFSKVEPHNSRDKCHYVTLDSFIKPKEKIKFNVFRKKSVLRGWIPKECHPLIESCSGDLNSYEVLWGSCSENQQILKLVSNLRNPDDIKMSCWKSLLNEVRTFATSRLSADPQLSQTTIKLLIANLLTSIKVVNHEIKYIRAMLSNKAERELSTLLFAYSFQVYWQFQVDQRNIDISHREKKKDGLREYFFQKIENRKMVKGGWDTKNMADNDLKISEKYALDYLDSITRHVLTTTQVKLEQAFEEIKESLKMGNILSNCIAIVDEQIKNHKNIEIKDKDHFVVRFICNRNALLEEQFHKKWNANQEKLMKKVDYEAQECFKKFVKELTNQFDILINYFGRLSQDLISKNCLFSDNNFSIQDPIENASVQIREAPFKAMAVYLNKFLNPMISPQEMARFFENTFEIDGVKVIKVTTSILPEKRSDANLSKENFKRLENTNIFNSELIFNIKTFISNFKNILMKQVDKFYPNTDSIDQIFEQLRHQYLKDALGCDMQCPSCGKFCERGIHNDGSKCQILTGHQYSSMGGKVWMNDEKKTAILFMCDDYRDYMTVKLPGKSIKWSEFKLLCGKEWNWDLPKDPRFKTSQEKNRDRMQNIWAKFGKGILKYYSQQGTTISFTPFRLIDMKYSFDEYSICFVIDGTGSMSSDIKRARISVSKLVKQYQKNGSKSFFRIIIYRDHCDEKTIETCPESPVFSTDSHMIMDYLQNVSAHGGGDAPEAMLDGLATAVTKTDWRMSGNNKKIIIHIYDAPPHGDFPNYKHHSSQSTKSHCCCCNNPRLCRFDWERDVWNQMKRLNIFYHGINTQVSYSNFEKTMKKNLGELCADFQVCGKEQVDEAIMELFINFHM